MNKKQEVIFNIKKLYRGALQDEKKRVQDLFKEILRDPYYKENMFYYFREILSK